MSNIQAQLTATIYEDFNQTIHNPYLINPSATDTSYNFKICFNNISELILIQDVNQFYVDADKKIIPKDESGFHFIGIQMTNSKLGEYINRSRLNLRYSWFLPIGPREALTAGATFGFINYAFLTTQGGSGGADFAPDGSFGVHYLKNRTAIGLGIQQIFTPVLIPVNQSFRLERLYNIDVAHQFFISQNLNLHPQAVFQINESMRYTYGINLLANVYNFGIIGVSNYYLRKTSAVLGLKNLNVLKSELSLILTYSKFHSEIPLRNGLLEIFISIQK